MTSINRWDIPRPIWTILATWGLAVLILAGLLSFWIWRNQQDTQQAAREAELQKDRAMCVMLELFTAGPAPVAGPAGDRGRAVLDAMHDYQRTLHCDSLPEIPRK